MMFAAAAVAVAAAAAAAAAVAAAVVAAGVRCVMDRGLVKVTIYAKSEAGMQQQQQQWSC